MKCYKLLKRCFFDTKLLWFKSAFLNRRVVADFKRVVGLTFFLHKHYKAFFLKSVEKFDLRRVFKKHYFLKLLRWGLWNFLNTGRGVVWIEKRWFKSSNHFSLSLSSSANKSKEVKHNTLCSFKYFINFSFVVILINWNFYLTQRHFGIKFKTANTH